MQTDSCHVTEQPPSSAWMDYLTRPRAGILLTLLFVALHLIGLTHHSFWVDEFRTYGVVQLPVEELKANRFAAGHIPTYFLMMKAWCEVAGASDWSLRAASTFFAALAFLAFFFLARSFLRDRLTFLLAIGLFFFQPFLYWSAREARMYSLLTAVSIFCVYCLLSYIIHRRWPFLLGYCAAVLFGMSLHLIFAFQLITHLVFMLVYYRRLFRGFLIAVALCVLAVTPLFFTTLQKNDYYHPKLTLRSPSFTRAAKNLGVLTSTSFRESWVYKPRNMGNVFVTTATFFFVVFLVQGIRRYRSLPPLQPENLQSGNPQEETLAREKLLLRYCFYWIAIPVFLMMMSELLNNPKVRPARYGIPMLGAVTILVTLSLRSFPRNRWGQFARWGYGIFFLIGLLTQAFYPGPGVRDTLYYIQKHYQPGDCVLLWSGGARRYGFSLYGMPYMKVQGIEEDNDNNTLNDPQHTLEQILTASQNCRRVWFLMDKAEDQEETFQNFLENYPNLFERFDEFKVRKTVVQGYRCLPRPTQNSQALPGPVSTQ
ncbi:MAG TPA: glycosyltransferase family 39 protein [Candidatus Sumerlaeota bacterium]|nr:glycosyltransferase family 39 protein [Candidatus Sumerlaeota bacterium]